MTAPAGPTKSLAVVLLQLGGPGSLDEVQPFLESMFRDPDLFGLSLPSRVRDWLAHRLSVWRARSVTDLYAAIGGRSPIRETTLRQAEKLERELDRELRCRVFVAMRYGSPSTEAAVDAVRAAGCRRVLLLPLYPQFAGATTGSSIREWTLRSREKGLVLPTERIDSYYRDGGYIAAVAERVGQALQRFSGHASPPHLVFSAHGLPARFVKQGDPYPQQVRESVRLVCRACPPGLDHTLCYQSRIGPQRWLKPGLVETLRNLGRDRVESVLVVPISFVSDHLETLSEINIEARKIALESGIRQFETMTGLNDSPAFISALASLVRSRPIASLAR